MIQELELPSNDPLITHFKKLAELYPFVEDRHNVVKITEKKNIVFFFSLEISN